jgi:hypothetical protein
MQVSCFQSIKQAIGEIRSKNLVSPRELSGGSIQKIIQCQLVELDVFSPSVFLNRRLLRFFAKDSFEMYTADLIGHYVTRSTCFKASIITSHLRSCCNQWCSTRRFGQPSRGCPFGCGSEQDDIEHCIVCDKFQETYHCIFMRTEFRLSYHNVFLLRGVGGELTDDLRKYVAIYVHLVFLSYNSCKHGKTLSRRSITHSLKRVSIHCYKARSLISKWRRFGIY